MHSRLSATRRVGRGARNNGQKMSRATSSGGGLKTGMVAKGPSSSASSNSNSKDVLTSSDDENDPTSCPDQYVHSLPLFVEYLPTDISP